MKKIKDFWSVISKNQKILLGFKILYIVAFFVAVIAMKVTP